MTIQMKLQNEAFGKRKMFVGEVDSIASAQEKVREFIFKANLGSSNFIGALLFDGNIYVGYISYNGRFWDSENKYAKEVLLVGADTLTA